MRKRPTIGVAGCTSVPGIIRAALKYEQNLVVVSSFFQSRFLRPIFAKRSRTLRTNAGASQMLL